MGDAKWATILRENLSTLYEDEEPSMKLFGQLIRTVVNLASLPVDAVRDASDLINGEYSIDESHIAERIQQLKEEAREDDD